MLAKDRRRPATCRPEKRRGQAAIELAVLTPVLMFVNLIAIDFGRIYYYTSIITNCARNGAMYASDPTASAISPYTSVTQAALADAPDLGTQPTVTGPVTGTDAAGNTYYEVTVTYTFHTMVTYPGIPASTTISRKVRMLKAPGYTY